MAGGGDTHFGRREIVPQIHLGGVRLGPKSVLEGGDWAPNLFGRREIGHKPVWEEGNCVTTCLRGGRLCPFKLVCEEGDWAPKVFGRREIGLQKCVWEEGDCATHLFGRREIEPQICLGGGRQGPKHLRGGRGKVCVTPVIKIPALSQFLYKYSSISMFWEKFGCCQTWKNKLKDSGKVFLIIWKLWNINLMLFFAFSLNKNMISLKMIWSA